MVRTHILLYSLKGNSKYCMCMVRSLPTTDFLRGGDDRRARLLGKYV